MTPAIRVEQLAKRYQLGVLPKSIGLRKKSYNTLKHAIMHVVTAPWRLGRRSEPAPSPSQNGHAARAGVGPSAPAIWALKDVSFEVGHGEIVGLIGTNGSGKSTLLKVLTGIVEPTAGRALVQGRVGSLLEMGTGFHPELSGRDNIYLGGSVLGMKRREIDRKFDEIVAFAEIAPFLDTPVKRYSSGMYIRLAFAVSSHLEPEILLLDEILSVGDVAFQKKCFKKMEQVARTGRTVILVSHDMTAILAMCKRTLLLREGRLLEYGPSAEVVAKYLNVLSSSSQDGQFDLSNHPARPLEYRHQPIITHLTLSSEKGVPSAYFYPDEPFTAEVTLKPHEPIRRPRIALSIASHSGNRLLTLGSFFDHQEVTEINSACRFRCTVPGLGLGSGHYLISLSLASGLGERLDSLEHAATLQIGWRNNYGNGEPFREEYGPLLKASTWERLA